MVSILGCGWLGFPLAKFLIDQGISVKGSTTSKNKFPTFTKAGIEPVLISLPLRPAQTNVGNFFEANTLVIAVPPSTHIQGPSFHIEQIESILPSISQANQLIYISSTSVYPEGEGSYSPDFRIDESNTGNPTLLATEQLLRKERPDVTIVRLGGLMGYDRIPGKRNPGSLPPQPQSPVNYIHRDDAVRIIAELIRSKASNQIVNGVAPEHPTRLQVYQRAAETQAWPIPELTSDNKDSQNRIIESTIHQVLPDYTFAYPDPLAFSYLKPNPEN
jgi:nucleoside-diphosphate-sugar epimerase